MTDLAYTTSDGLAFECGPYSYHHPSKERYVECEIEVDGGFYGGSCSHFIELTRADLMALLDMLDVAEKRDS